MKRRMILLVLVLLLMPLCLAHSDDNAFLDGITDYIKEGESSFLVIIILSFVLGIIHSFLPGHGKSVIVSYLLGRYATVKSVLIIALSTTITHISDIFIVGLLLLFLLPSSIKPTIEEHLALISAILIIVFGIYLLIKNLKHHHEHDHTKKGLVILGVVVGLAPCPTAWALYLVLLNLGLYFKAFISILAFGAGLLLTISVLGVVFIKAKKLLKFIPGESKFVKLLPLFSSIFIIIIGIVLLLKHFI